MKRAILITAIALGLIITSSIAEDTNPAKPAMPAGVTGAFETVQSKVLKVYSAEDNGAHFRAYVVKWKDTEVIVSDPLGRNNKEKGDSITFMVYRIEMPHGEEKIKMLQFMIMEFPGMPKHKALDRTTPSTEKRLRVEVHALCTECQAETSKFTDELPSECEKCEKKSVRVMYRCKGDVDAKCENRFAYIPPERPKQHDDAAMLKHERAQMEASKCPKCKSYNTGPMYTEAQRKIFEELRKKYSRKAK